MATLSQVLGGILRDVTRARVNADLQTQELFEAYRTDPLLSRVPIPRVIVRELSVRLRFAVDEHVEPENPTQADVAKASQSWLEHLRREVLPRIYRVAAEERDIDSVLMTKLVGQLRAPQRALGMEKALAGDLSALASESVRAVTDAKRRLTTSDQRRLPALSRVQAVAAQEVARATTSFMPRLRHQLAAEATARGDLRILVRDADLAGIEESRLQEVSVTLSSDDVEFAGGTMPVDIGQGRNSGAG